MKSDLTLFMWRISKEKNTLNEDENKHQYKTLIELSKLTRMFYSFKHFFIDFSHFLYIIDDFFSVCYYFVKKKGIFTNVVTTERVFLSPCSSIIYLPLKRIKHTKLYIVLQNEHIPANNFILYSNSFRLVLGIDCNYQ